MPINIPSFIIGYHGCDKDLAEKETLYMKHLDFMKKLISKFALENLNL